MFISLEYWEILRHTLPLVLVSKAVAFLAFGLFRWRYVSIRDIHPIAGRCTLGSLLFWGVDHLFLVPAINVQAGAMREGGEVFVLDMGEPMKIVDLAKNLIRLSGKELGMDADIVFTGLCPGEKLHEELDALVKGYWPIYEFHGDPEATVEIEPDLPFPRPKSVH